MPKSEIYNVKHKMSLNDLDKRIKYLERMVKVLKRLKFIRYRYKGLSVEKAAAKVQVTKSVGYIWQKRWNRDGYVGLVPKYKGGRAPKLTIDQKREIQEIIQKNEHFSTRTIKTIIENKFGITYSLKQVRLIIKELKNGHII